MFRDSAHAFCQQELMPTILKVCACVYLCLCVCVLMPTILQANRNEHFDVGLMRKMGEQVGRGL